MFVVVVVVVVDDSCSLFFHRCPLCRVTSGRMIKSQEQDVRSLSYSFQFGCVMGNNRSEYCTKIPKEWDLMGLKISRLGHSDIEA